MSDVVYLDHAATTPVRPEVVEAMLPFLGDRFGNPSGAHRLARDARRALDEARAEVAACLDRGPGEVIFTSGGTEADNLAVLGTVAAAEVPGATAVCSAIEHHAVLHPMESLGGRTVDVDSRGLVDLDHLAAILDELGDRAAIVSVIAANNEVGTIQDLAAVAAVVRRHVPGAAFHSDAVQAARYTDVASLTAPCDLVTITAHKIGGPKGVGALVARHDTPLRPRVLGGGQERDRRSGTQD
ncbi:MAG: cysteine desulfurase family protein, partial [Acidimicrobiales bacterium]